MGTLSADDEAEKQFEADMANTLTDRSGEGDVREANPSNDDAAEAAFQADFSQTTAPAAEVLEPKQLEEAAAAAGAADGVADEDASLATAAVAVDAVDTATAAATSDTIAADSAADDAGKSESGVDVAADASAADPAPADSPNQDAQIDFAFEDPDKLAKSMKEDWGGDGWEEDMSSFDYLGTDIDDDDMFQGNDYLEDGMMFSGDNGKDGDQSRLGVSGGVEDDDAIERDEDLEQAEWQYDALNDVDGGEDDDVDNIAEAFAQGELNRQTQEEIVNEDSSSPPADATTNLDKAWGDSWTVPRAEMDGSARSHFQAAKKAISTHVDVKKAILAPQQRMKHHIATTMGLDPNAKGNQLYLTLASILPFVPVVFLIACVGRVIKRTITMYRAVQIANVYCACFCGMLVLSGLLTHGEPLASYQFLSGNSQYVQYQVVVLFVFTLYLILMVLNAMANAFWWPNAGSVVLATVVGIHYYFSVWHPAMLAQPPQSAWGLPSGSSTYTVYMCTFAVLALVPPKDAAVFHAFEDKEKGSGKAQD